MAFFFSSKRGLNQKCHYLSENIVILYSDKYVSLKNDNLRARERESEEKRDRKYGPVKVSSRFIHFI